MAIHICPYGNTYLSLWQSVFAAKRRELCRWRERLLVMKSNAGRRPRLAPTTGQSGRQQCTILFSRLLWCICLKGKKVYLSTAFWKKLFILEGRASQTGHWERRAEKQLEKHCHKTLGSKSFIGYPQVAVACEPNFRLTTHHAILVWWPTTSAMGGSGSKGKHHDWPKTWKGSEVFTLMQCNDRWGVLLVNCKN